MSVSALTTALTLVCLFFSRNAVITHRHTHRKPLVILTVTAEMHPSVKAELLAAELLFMSRFVICFLGSIQHNACTAVHVARNLSPACICRIFLRLPQTGELLLFSCHFPVLYCVKLLCTLLQCDFQF